MEGQLSSYCGDLMQHVALLAFDKGKCKPFFNGLTEFFNEHHHSESQNSDGYETLLYKIHRPFLVVQRMNFPNLLQS
mgnify:CR=1 FL=1